MNVPLLDLRLLYERQRHDIDAAIARVVAAQAFIMGPEVSGFEREVEAFLGGDVHAIGCANGSDAIVLALRAMEIGPGDEVIAPAFSFASTATSIDLVGARPVFVDIEPESFNLDPARLASALTPKTRAVIAVHLFGRAADVPAIRSALDAAGRADVRIIEDAAQALGAKVDGVPVGKMGDIATTSFFPSKNLGAFGDGGMVVTRDDGLAETVGMLRTHGMRKKYYNERIGQNSRLDALQAAVLRVKLPALRGWCAERAENAAAYRTAFAARGLSSTLRWTTIDARFDHIYNQFVLRVPRRDALLEHLRAADIGCAVYYPRTLPAQPCYAELGYSDADTPVASACAQDSLAIPVFPGLRADQRAHVVETIASFYGA